MEKMKKGNKIGILLAAFFCLTLFLGKTDVWAAKTVDLARNKWYKDNSLYYKQIVYHKVKTEKTGCIIIDGYGYSKVRKGKFDLDIQIYDGKMRPAQTEKIKLTKANKYRTYVSVKKGTYYIKVQDSLYKLKYSFKEIPDKSGARMEKAKWLAKGETAQGLLLLGESGKKSDWYRLNLPEKRKVTFTFGARSNKLIEFKIHRKEWKITGATLYRLNTTKSDQTAIEMPKGVYYIQVKRQGNNKNASGFYSVKWK